jgi:hypothetical protein
MIDHTIKNDFENKMNEYELCMVNSAKIADCISDGISECNTWFVLFMLFILLVVASVVAMTLSSIYNREKIAFSGKKSFI